MAADRYSNECKRLLEQYGYYRKIPDIGYRDRSTKQLETPAERPGTPDAVFLNRFGGCFIEHKAGSGRKNMRFDFAEWREKQREFDDFSESIGVPYYLFLVMGNNIRDREFPRVAFLLRGKEMKALMIEAGERKSLSYKTAVERLAHARLAWERGQWVFPPDHDFVKHFVNKETLTCFLQPSRTHTKLCQMTRLTSIRVRLRMHKEKSSRNIQMPLPV